MSSTPSQPSSSPPSPSSRRIGHLPQYDVAVIGAGLAGLQAARLLGRAGLKVLLADQKEEVGDPVQTTGIFVRKTLEDFVLPESCLGPAVDRVTLYSPKGRELHLRGNEPEFRVADVAGIYRHFLRDAESCGVDWAPEHRYHYCEPLNGGSVLRFVTPTGTRYVRARFVVGADGARSRVAQDLGLDRNRDFIVGIEDVLHGLPSDRGTRPPAFHCFLGPELAPGYVAWVVDDGEAVHVGLGGYAERFNPVEALATFRTQVQRRFGIDPDRAERIERRGGRIPVGGVLGNIAGPRGLLVGDAAGAVSPLTAGGLDACMRLSELAARVIPRYLSVNGFAPEHNPLLAYDGQRFRSRFVSRRFVRRFFKHLRHPLMVEAAFSLLAKAPLDAVARHVFFGRGSFPAIDIGLGWDQRLISSRS